jgi:hypothetical protein
VRTLHLHIGVPKTASSWMQRAIFPRMPHLDAVCLPRGAFFAGDADREDDGRILSGLFRRAPEIWDDLGETLLDALLAGTGGADRDVLLSDEGMGRQASRPPMLGAHLRAMKRHAMRRGFERVRVLGFIRRQDQWLASHYAQRSGVEPRAGQRGFEELVDEVIDPMRGRYNFGMLLDWGALLSTLHDSMGEEDVMVIPHERLEADPGATIGAICDWTGADGATRASLVADAVGGERDNVRSAGEIWRLRPRRRQVGPLRLGGPLTLQGGSISLTPDLSDRILSAYARANDEVARLGIEVGRYGYCRPEAPADQ